MCNHPGVEHLPTICEVLGSISAKQKGKGKMKKKKKKKIGEVRRESKKERREKGWWRREEVKRDADRLLCIE